MTALRVPWLPVWPAACLALACAGCGLFVIGDGHAGRALFNAEPVAAAVFDDELVARRKVSFDASGSFDPDGQIVSFRWEFGDGSVSDSAIVDHIYDRAGEYTVRLTVEDDLGAVDSLVLGVTVTERNLATVLLAVVVEPSGRGIVTLDPPGGVYELGTQVVLSAVPADGYVFEAYVDEHGSIVGVDPVHLETIARDATLTARFIAMARETFALTASVTPPEGGTVTLVPSGGAYGAGTLVTAVAAPSAGFEFVGFSGDVTSNDAVVNIVIDRDTVIVAEFAPKLVALNVTVVPQGVGSISLDPPGGVYPQGSRVTVTANPSAGYVFAGYSGAVSSRESIVAITLDQEKTITAAFAWSPAIGNPGNLLVTGFVGNNVQEFDRFDGTRLGEIVSEGGGLVFPSGIDFGPGGDFFVVNAGLISNTSVMRYAASDGAFVETFIAGVNLTGFLTLRFGPNGNLFVPSSNGDSIDEYDGGTGELVRTFVGVGSGGLDGPLGLAFGPGGHLFVVSRNSDSVIEYDGLSGAAIGTYADFAAIGASVPVDLVFNDTGDMFVTVSGDDSVARVDAASGAITTFVPSRGGGLDSPAGILFHPDRGNLLVVSQGTDEVLEFHRTTGDFVAVFAAGMAGENLFFMAFRPR